MNKRGIFMMQFLYLHNEALFFYHMLSAAFRCRHVCVVHVRQVLSRTEILMIAGS